MPYLGKESAFFFFVFDFCSFVPLKRSFFSSQMVFKKREIGEPKSLFKPKNVNTGFDSSQRYPFSSQPTDR